MVAQSILEDISLKGPRRNVEIGAGKVSFALVSQEHPIGNTITF